MKLPPRTPAPNIRVIFCIFIMWFILLLSYRQYDNVVPSSYYHRCHTLLIFSFRKRLNNSTCYWSYIWTLCHTSSLCWIIVVECTAHRVECTIRPKTNIIPPLVLFYVTVFVRYWYCQRIQIPPVW